MTQTTYNDIHGMSLEKAIKLRHSVRKYRDDRIEGNILQLLREEIERCNKVSGICMKLVTDDSKAFSGIMSYGIFRGVSNYIVVAAPRGNENSVLAGYYGEMVVLKAQTLGLNTCWVGLTYRKTKAYSIPEGMNVLCVIAVGYGETQGVPHKTKTPEQVSNVTDDSPQWFKDGVDAALLGPSAVHQQKFKFMLTGETNPDGKPTVEASAGFSLIGYTWIDLGIAMAHFEIGCNGIPFAWTGKDIPSRL